MFVTKLDLMKKQHKREPLKINLLHQRDIDADNARRENGENPADAVMEELKYYENLDLEKLEDEHQREMREKREEQMRQKQKLTNDAPLRHKMKIGFIKFTRPIKRKEENIFKKMGYEVNMI